VVVLRHRRQYAVVEVDIAPLIPHASPQPSPRTEISL